MTRVTNPQTWRKKIVEKKRINKAITLRKYAKLAKQEGIQSDRVRLDNNPRSSSESHPSPEIRKKSKAKPNRPNLEVQARQVMEEKQRRQEEHKQEQIQAIEQALKKRKEKKAMMTAKNKKGQPLFKGKILNILDKLTKG
ncbi:hypothetical protein EON64_03475 [archaeon]|nr:MAG: hypothetical protein EON64_03475 [archaeon]